MASGTRECLSFSGTVSLGALLPSGFLTKSRSSTSLRLQLSAEDLPPSPPPAVAVSFKTRHLRQADRRQRTLLSLRPHCNSTDCNPAVQLGCNSRDFATWHPHPRKRPGTLAPHRSAPGSSNCLCLFHSLNENVINLLLTLLGVDVLCELNGVVALVGDLIPEEVLLLLLLLHVELQLRIHKHSD